MVTMWNLVLNVCAFVRQGTNVAVICRNGKLKSDEEMTVERIGISLV